MREKFSIRVRKDMRRNWVLYLMVLPVIAFFLVFCYKPMYGALIAFQDYRPARGFGEEWVGFKHFLKFFRSHYFVRLFRNTFLISLYSLVFAFPASIILALLLNEVPSRRFKNISQMFMHLPHFVSMVVVCGLVREFCYSDGLIADLLEPLGVTRSNLLLKPELYRSIYVISGIWKELGWSSLIYIAALGGVDTALYDAASIDGAGRWKKMLHITIPGIMPTIIVMLILKVGGMMSVGYEKTLLLYNNAILDTSDIISTYVYRYGIENMNYSYSTAVGLFNSVINVILVLSTNYISKKVSDNSLW
ncbi:MAG: sugar ABC transporter permease [Lachnospiraceae bacterium]|nr:sugar ABC transporter permease [Lachnospiraceae bacterium]